MVIFVLTFHWGSWGRWTRPSWDWLPSQSSIRWDSAFSTVRQSSLIETGSQQTHCVQRTVNKESTCTQTYCSWLEGSVYALRLTVLCFFLVSRNAKLYDTAHCFAEFWSFCETEKMRKYKQNCFKLFRETDKKYETLFHDFIFRSFTCFI